MCTVIVQIFAILMYFFSAEISVRLYMSFKIYCSKIFCLIKIVQYWKLSIPWQYIRCPNKFYRLLPKWHKLLFGHWFELFINFNWNYTGAETKKIVVVVTGVLYFFYKVYYQYISVMFTFRYYGQIVRESPW